MAAHADIGAAFARVLAVVECAAAFGERALPEATRLLGHAPGALREFGASSCVADDSG